MPGAYSKCFIPLKIGVEKSPVSIIYLETDAKKASVGSNRPIVPILNKIGNIPAIKIINGRKFCNLLLIFIIKICAYFYLFVCILQLFH